MNGIIFSSQLSNLNEIENKLRFESMTRVLDSLKISYLLVKGVYESQTEDAVFVERKHYAAGYHLASLYGQDSLLDFDTGHPAAFITKVKGKGDDGYLKIEYFGDPYSEQTKTDHAIIYTPEGPKLLRCVKI